MNLPKIEALLRKYAPNDTEYDLVFTHGKIVAEIALWCADNIDEAVDREALETAALLHDIGSYPFSAASGVSPEYKKSYPQHALVGAKILAEEGYDKSVWSLLETHVLLGITPTEIDAMGWAVPSRNYEPATIEGRLLCYADRFHSKDPMFNAYDAFLQRLEDNFPAQAQKFKDWSAEFGIPDIAALAKKYQQPIR
jgi:uncharacterized protein